MLDRPVEDTLVSRIVAVDVITRQVCPSLRGPLARFYGEILGLRDANEGNPASSALRFVCERMSLLFEFAETPRTPSGHVTLLVNSIDVAESRLTEHAVEFERLHGFSVTDQRIELYDPARHPVTLVQTWPF